MSQKEITSKVPKLRFREFQDKWISTKLGNILTEYKQQSMVNNEYEVLTSSNKWLIRQKDYYVESRLAERDNSGFNIIPKWYITYRSRSDNGRFTFNLNSLGIDWIISVYYPVFWSKFCDKNFLVEYLNYNWKLISPYSVGTSQRVLSYNSLNSIFLDLPWISEQQKIASFFSLVDEKIEKLKTKKSLLEKYKKWVIKKIFSREIRFWDENGEEFGEWEKKKMREIAKFSKWKGISKSDINENGMIECIRYGELYTIYRETISSVKSRTNIDIEDLVLSEENDVIIPASGETEIDIATASCVLRSWIALWWDLNILKTKLNWVFLSYYLNSVKKNEIASMAQGIAVVHLYASQLQNLEIEIPSISEQQKISLFLSGIDKKIEALNSEIEWTKKWKKGLLQGMFI